jgi:hypothetical protein
VAKIKLVKDTTETGVSGRAIALNLWRVVMGENSKIEWCDHTFNPWIGCQKVSPGCDNCYAEAMMDHPNEATREYRKNAASRLG